VPQLPAEPAAAVVGAHDEEAHEPVAAAVRDDRAATDELAVELRRDEAVRIGRPEHLRVADARLPALVLGPPDEHLELVAAHGPDHQVAGPVLPVGGHHALPSFASLRLTIVG